jgi:hypothetical protein
MRAHYITRVDESYLNHQFVSIASATHLHTIVFVVMSQLNRQAHRYK